jgi:hypothetical protein
MLKCGDSDTERSVIDRMALALDKPKLDNLASDIWKSAPTVGCGQQHLTLAA